MPDARLPGGVAGPLVGDWEVVHVQAEEDILSEVVATDGKVPLRARVSAGVQRAFHAAAFRRFREEGDGYMDGGGGAKRSPVPDVTLGGDEGEWLGSTLPLIPMTFHDFLSLAFTSYDFL